MPSAIGNIKQRPVRIGILVRDGNIDDLANAASLNTLLWGGIYNPIIPVNPEDDSFSVELLKLYNPDLLYSIIEDINLKTFIDKYKRLDFEDFMIDPLFSLKTKTLNYLDLLDIIGNVYEKEFKHKSEGFISNFFYGIWKEEDKNSYLYSVLYGKIPEWFDLKNYYKEYYKDGLFANEIDIDEDTGLDNILFKISPIRATGVELNYKTNRPYERAGIFIGEKDNFIDLVNFWNLRATGIKVSYFCLGDDRFKKYNEHILKEIDNSLTGKFDNIYFYSSLDNQIQDNVKEIISDYKKFITFKNNIVISNISRISFNGMNLKYANNYFNDGFSSVGYISEDKPFSSIFPINNKFISSESSKFKNLVYSFSSNIEFELSNYTYYLPSVDLLYNFYKRNLFEDKFIKSGMEGIEFIDNSLRDYIRLTPIKKDIIILEIFKQIGCKKVELSDSGIQTRNIIKQIGDNIRSLEGGRVFKIRGVRKLISKLKVDDVVTRSEAEKIIFDNGYFKRFESLFIERRDNDKLSSRQVFDYLLKNDFFRAGLKLNCNSCNLGNWLSLKNMDDNWECEYCGNKNITSLELRNRGDWKFKRSGLFGKDNNQEGAIPVIITLLVFNRIIDRYNTIFYTESLNLDFGGSDKCEVDFCILNQDYSHRGYPNDKLHIEIGIGEVKSKGNIDKNDIDNLKFVRKKLIDNGIDCYLVFSKTDEEFTDIEIGMFEDLKKENIDIILITNQEVEPYTPYFEIKQHEKLPYPYANNLYEMSKNSDYLYLTELTEEEKNLKR